MRIATRLLLAVGAIGLLAAPARAADDILPSVAERYAPADVEEVPNFQQHVVPLLGRLGCNGRACHGSFQGRGGFMLSLFGYDFNADYQAMRDPKSPRIDQENPLESLIYAKPSSDDEFVHEGGQRFTHDSWQGRVIRRWLEAGAKFESSEVKKLERLVVEPAEIIFTRKGLAQDLRVIAHWADGQREDVTPLCRFTTNNEQVAAVDEAGRVSAGDPGDTHVVVSYDKAVVAVPILQPVSDLVGDRYPAVPTPTKVDELVVEKLRKLGVVPSELADDADFLRRVRLDLTGTLPTPAEVEAFLADPSADKRARKIDELLETPQYAAWWAQKLCDWTGNNADTVRQASALQGRPSEEWYAWVRKRVAENVPYDQLIEGIVVADSRKPGQSYYDFCQEMSEISRDGVEAFAERRETMPYFWARQNIRQSEEKAIAFAYSFLGVRIECAQCHKHPFDVWSKDDFDQFKGFFAGLRYDNNGTRAGGAEFQKIMEELGLARENFNQQRRNFPALLREGKVLPFAVAYVEPIRRATPTRRGSSAPASTKAQLLDGPEIDLARVDDPRKPIMQWLRDPGNPYFAKAFVNRVWSGYFNVGIVQPPDDMSIGNPPSNAALLDHLAAGFIASGFDMKWVHREIANSATYQASWKPNDTNRLDERNFSRAIPRRMPAEVVFDALAQASAGDRELAQLAEGVGGRSIADPNVSLARRGSGNSAYALTVFGRSTRDTNCDCDRSEEASLLQVVYLQNDPEVLRQLDRRGGWVDELRRSLQPGAKPTAEQLGDIIRQAYLRSLSRPPSESETARSLEYLQASDDLAGAARDLIWALVNTKEFIINH